jgi:hypothetical protein
MNNETRKKKISLLPTVCEFCGCKLETINSMFDGEISAVCINCDEIFELPEEDEPTRKVS